MQYRAGKDFQNKEERIGKEKESGWVIEEYTMGCHYIVADD